MTVSAMSWAMLFPEAERSLWTRSPGALTPFRGEPVGPLARVGTTGDDDGAYGWATQIDLHR